MSVSIESDAIKSILHELIDCKHILELDSGIYIEGGFVSQIKSYNFEYHKNFEDTKWITHNPGNYDLFDMHEQYRFNNSSNLINDMVNSYGIYKNNVRYTITWLFHNKISLNIHVNTHSIIYHIYKLGAYSVTFYYLDTTMKEYTLNHDSLLSHYPQYTSPIIGIDVYFNFDNLIKGG